MASSSIPKRVIEACCDRNSIGKYRFSKYQCVDLLTNEIYDSLVEIYSRWFKLNMDNLHGDMDRFSREAGPEYEGKMYLYFARVYISAFFHDLYVSNRFACHQKGCSDAYNSQYFKEMTYLSRTYDSFLAHLLGSILPTEIKHTHGSTMFIPLINPNIELGDDNRNYLGITNWVYNSDCLTQFIHLCRSESDIMDMQPIPKNVNGRPFWLFDWHDSCCYSWFPVESNYTIEDMAMAYIIGTACTAKLAPRDYDEWQDFPNNIRPIKAHANDHERVRGLVYHGYKLVRTMEVQSFVIPHDIVAQAVVRKQGSGGASPSEQDELKGKQQSDESTNEQGVHELSQRNSEKKSPSVILSNIEQFRLVDYLYHSKVIRRHQEHKRWEAFVEMLFNNSRRSF